MFLILVKIQNRVPFDWTIRSARCFPRMLFVCLKCTNEDPLFLFPFPLYYSFIDCAKYLASDRAIAKLKERQQTTLQPLALNGRNQTDSGGVRPEADSGGGEDGTHRGVLAILWRHPRTLSQALCLHIS